MHILVVNCGSSSLKYQLVNIDAASYSVLAKGLVDRIGGESKVKHTAHGETTTSEESVANHTDALDIVLRFLVEAHIIASLDDVDAIGHRVVHGGEHFSTSVVVTEDIKPKLFSLDSIAPLHNPANMMGVRACEAKLPGKPNVVVFDTAFHQTIPQENYLYAIPYELYEKYNIRRYGFHGTSHQYVAQRLGVLLDKPRESLKVITCHVGNGASITAIDQGKVIDTSMGFTPLQGLMMGTRSGDIDPAVITFLMEKENLSPKDIDTLLNKKSGVLGLTGLSGDMRDIENGFLEGKERETLAMHMYINRIIKYIGSYVALLNGVDAIVFTAGVLENSPVMRKLIVDSLHRLGTEIDEAANNTSTKEKCITTSGSHVPVRVIPTDEEQMIARETLALLQVK